MRDLNDLALPDLFARLTRDAALDALWERARREDLATDGDVTTLSIAGHDAPAEATMRPRAVGVASGLAALPALAASFGSGVVEMHVADGDEVGVAEPMATLRGSMLDVLALERTALNLVGHLSGIATLTRAFVARIAGTNAVMCDTRKTTPGLRELEKYAVRCGGGHLHRIGLYDAALFKDNHLALMGTPLADTLASAIASARKRSALSFVEVEVDSLAQLEVVLECDVDIILLDNMSTSELSSAVAMRDDAGGNVLLEASGGITIDTVADVARTGVDRIAVGALTHSAPSFDVGLDIVS